MPCLRHVIAIRSRGDGEAETSTYRRKFGVPDITLSNGGVVSTPPPPSQPELTG
jgi:hypothetical protein